MPRIISHGGFTARHRENTIAAFLAAVEARVSMIEMDVHQTSDGDFVVHHDLRLSEDSPAWSDLTSASILEMMKTDPRAPSLSSCLDTIGAVPVNLDVKSYRCCSYIVQYLRSHPLPAGSILSSFDYRLLIQLHKIRFDLPLFLNTSISPRRSTLHNIRSATFCPLPQLVPSFLRGLSVNDRLVSHRLVRSLHRRGLLIYVWTVDDLVRMKRLVQWDVDGVITNHPDLLMADCVNGSVSDVISATF